MCLIFSLSQKSLHPKVHVAASARPLAAVSKRAPVAGAARESVVMASREAAVADLIAVVVQARDSAAVAVR